MRGAIDAQQHGRPSQPVAPEQIHHRLVGGAAAGLLVPSDVDGQLDRLRAGPRQVGGPGQNRPGEQPGSLERHQTLERQPLDLGQGALDTFPRIDRHRHQREILGEREQAIGMEVVLDAKALGAPHDQTALQPVSGVGVGQRVGQKPIVGAVAPTEVGRQFQAVLVHSQAPRCRPAQAARTPSTRLSTKFTAARRSWPSSPRR